MPPQIVHTVDNVQVVVPTIQQTTNIVFHKVCSTCACHTSHENMGRVIKVDVDPPQHTLPNKKRAYQITTWVKVVFLFIVQCMI